MLCLLYTRRPLTKSTIRRMVPQYGAAASDEAFDRMFERDKDELRELGIPLVTEETSSIWEDEAGYRIDQREYALPEISFEPDELAVLGLASRTWAHASLAGPAAQALRKLKASGIERDSESLIGIEPRLRTSEPAFDEVKNAVVSRREVEFAYRTSGEAQARQRHVQPWGLASWHGRWYLTGHDLDRDAPRVFRLSRISGPVKAVGRVNGFEVPPDHRPRDMIRTTVGEQRQQQAVVRARDGRGQSLRRRAAGVRDAGDGWFELTVVFTDAETFADEVTGYGPDVVVLEPAEVREVVVRRLAGAAEAHARAAETDAAGTPAHTGSAREDAKGERG